MTKFELQKQVNTLTLQLERYRTLDAEYQACRVEMLRAFQVNAEGARVTADLLRDLGKAYEELAALRAECELWRRG